MPERSKVAIIGAGAVGCYYGARLAEAGHTVSFLMRRDYQAVRDNGLRITSPEGDYHLERPTVVRSSSEIGPVDWVICALKATSLDEVPALIEPCLGPSTRILMIMNGLGLEERFAGWFGAERIFGALAFTCINRGEPGVVHHLRFGALTIGHYEDDPTEVASAVDLWKDTKVSVTGAPSLLQARWEKLCWNIPFNGMTIAAGGVPTDRILGDPELRATTRALMEEVAAIGNVDLGAHDQEARLNAEAIIERMIAMTETMGAYQPSTLTDFLAGNSLEIDAIFANPLARARALDVPAPRLAMLTSILRSLDRRSLARDQVVSLARGEGAA